MRMEGMELVEQVAQKVTFALPLPLKSWKSPWLFRQGGVGVGICLGGACGIWWTSRGLTQGKDAQEHWEGTESDPENSTGRPS